MHRTPSCPDHLKALRFVVSMGVVSLLFDIVYEAARSVSGPFLGFLGANATTVGIVAGLGELVGYGLRYAAGRASDATRAYWAFTIAGYGLTFVAVPALALAGLWPVAAGLLVAERLGKAIRTPARDALLATAGDAIGTGRAFGVHEAIDQVGAVLGPLFVAAVLAWKASYRMAFAWTVLPGVAAMALLLWARRYDPGHGTQPARLVRQADGITRRYRFYVGGAALLAAGTADFALIAFHLAASGTVSAAWIPLLYAGAMVVDAVSAIVLGKWYDAQGPRILSLIAIGTALAAPLLFLGNVPAMVAGVVVWGFGMGAMEGVLRAGVSDLVPAQRRGTAFGQFHLVFGVAWFAGSTLMGYLYDVSLRALVLAAVALHLLAVPLLWAAATAPPAAPDVRT
jgi:predicted MFS family arabinose efflux permease